MDKKTLGASLTALAIGLGVGAASAKNATPQSSTDIHFVKLIRNSQRASLEVCGIFTVNDAGIDRCRLGDVADAPTLKAVDTIFEASKNVLSKE